MIKDTYDFSGKPYPWFIQAGNWLMKFTWGIDYTTFSHICPYFWLSVFNIFAFPFTILIKYVLWKLILSNIGNLLIGVTEKVAGEIEEKTGNYYQFLYRGIHFIHETGEYDVSVLYDVREKKVSKFLEWVGSNKGWNVMKGIRYAYYNWSEGEYERERQKKMERLIAQRKKINDILRVVKPIAQFIILLLGIAIGVLAIWATGLLVNWLQTLKLPNFSSIWHTVLEVLMWIGIVVVGGVIVAFIIDALVRSKAVGKSVISLGGAAIWPFVTLWRVIRGAVVFIYRMIGDNCPAVKW